MTKYIHDDILDAIADAIIADGNKMTVCNAYPTTYAQASSTPASSGYMLAEQTIDSGDFTKANGDSSGRKVTLAAQNIASADYSGDATHIAVIDTVNSKILAVTEMPSAAVTASDPFDTVAVDLAEVGDPT